MAQNCSCHGSGDKHSQTVAAVLERPRYSPGLILEDSDLTSAVDYTRSLSRLLFRNLFGCGVICGLVVSVKKECGLVVTIAPGLALDGCGDPIEVPGPIRITLDTAEVETLENQPQNKAPPEFWVVLCGKEKMCAPRALVCDADDFDGVTQPTRIRALAEVSLAFTPPECACKCRLRNLPVQQEAGAPSLEEEFDCQLERELRIECSPDCGCGSACACGCCLVLAHVWLDRSANEDPVWKVMNRGVRNYIRPQFLDDPADREDGDVWGRSRPTAIYSKDIGDNALQETVRKVYPELRAGDPLTPNHIARIVELTRRPQAAPEETMAQDEAVAIAAEASRSGSASTGGSSATGKKSLGRARPAKAAKPSGGSS